MKGGVNVEILGIDAGNSNIKVVGNKGELTFPSALGEHRERKLVQKFSENDIEYEFRGTKGFAGTLAKYESQFSVSKMGATKAHKEMLIRVLLGITRYSNGNNFKIIVGQPISYHIEEEKNKMKSILVGSHEIEVNGQHRLINIEDVEVAAESGSAFWSNPTNGLVRILDIGSGTVNVATLIEGRYIDKDSFTITDGLETLVSNDLNAFARKIAIDTLKRWDENDLVFLCGGGAEKMEKYIRDHYFNTKVLKPQLQYKDNDGVIQGKQLSPIYGNAVGYFNIAKKQWSQ